MTRKMSQKRCLNYIGFRNKDDRKDKSKEMLMSKGNSLLKHHRNNGGLTNSEGNRLDDKGGKSKVMPVWEGNSLESHHRDNGSVTMQTTV